MKTVFKVGMEVYDQVNNPNKKGKVLDIKEDAFSHKIHSYDYPIEVQFEGEDDLSYYDLEGCPVWSSNPTLSTSPYTLQGFEQKAPVPTYEEAQQWMIDQKGKTSFIGSPNEIDKNFINYSYYEAFEALKKLVILRDYYNEGWQPDWSKKNKMHFCIRVRNNKITIDNNSDINEFNTVLVFRDYTIRDKFLEEQRELLKIVKPLL